MRQSRELKIKSPLSPRVRIVIVDLPPVEILTPEETELIFGSGLLDRLFGSNAGTRRRKAARTLTQVTESMEVRTLMSAVNPIVGFESGQTKESAAVFASSALQASTQIGAPTLQGPAGSIANATPTFTWSAVPNANSYDLWVDQQGGTKQIIRRTVSGSTSFSATSALASACP